MDSLQKGTKVVVQRISGGTRPSVWEAGEQSPRAGAGFAMGLSDPPSETPQNGKEPQFALKFKSTKCHPSWTPFTESSILSPGPLRGRGGTRAGDISLWGHRTRSGTH